MKRFKKNLALILLSVFIAAFSAGLSSYAAKLYFSPSSSEFTEGCESSVSIMIDTEGDSSSAADALIFYDPDDVEIVDQDSDIVGTQIRKGNAYEFYPGNKVEAGKIYLTGASLMSPLNGTKTMGTIILKGKPGVTSTQLTYDFTLGDTTDSNISDTTGAIDLLSSVTNGNYTFIDLGYCGTDTGPPIISNVEPAPGSRNNPLDSDITFDISDSRSGVDIDTVVVNIDGTDYQKGDSEFSYVGDKNRYSITIDPATDFLTETPVFVEIDGEDTAGNVMNTYKYSFNHPVDDDVSPYVTNPVPAPGQKNVALDSNIIFHIKDDISGVSIDSIVVRIDGVSYQKGDSNFSFSGNPNDYFIVIDPDSDFDEGTPVYIEIDAVDLRGNVMNTYKYSFNHPTEDRQPPYVVSPVPSPGARNVSLSTDISFNIKDNLSGVDIDTLIVEVDGVVYTKDSPEINYSGTDKNYFVSIDPSQDFEQDQEIRVRIDAADKRGNAMSTYTYSFNKPAVCGDNKVELSEECEPPNTSGCSADCRVVLCEAVEEGEAVCGNRIVEAGEDCEPPLLGNCDGYCELAVDVEDEITQYEEFQALPETQKIEVLRLISDSDNDGIPNVIEELYKTEGDSKDSDGDGISDAEEILDYGTDPNDALSRGWDRTRIVNWKDGDITASSILFVKGVGHDDKPVKVYAESVEFGTEYYLGETTADDKDKWALISETPLEEGSYLLRAESYYKDGKLLDTSDLLRITIDLSAGLDKPIIKTIDEVSVVDNVRVVVYNRQPLVFGTTDPSSQVFVMFESSILSSTVFSDSLTGFFTVFSPRPLELGPHEVTVYAVNTEGVVSGPTVAEFEIRDRAVALDKFCWWCWLLVVVILSLIIAVSYHYYQRYKKKQLHEYDEGLKKDLTDPNRYRKKKGKKK